MLLFKGLAKKTKKKGFTCFIANCHNPIKAMMILFIQSLAFIVVNLNSGILFEIINNIANVLFIFSDYGTSCCSKIRVTLNGIAKEKEGRSAGTYQKASGLINKKFHWSFGQLEKKNVQPVKIDFIMMTLY